MATAKEILIADALTLSEADRLEVINRLIESLGTSDISAVWDAGIDQRLNNIESGRAKFVSWKKARRRIAGNGLVDRLLSCPVKGYFQPIESESTDEIDVPQL